MLNGNAGQPGSSPEKRSPEKPSRFSHLFRKGDKPKMAATGLLLALAVMVAVALVFQFIKEERARDLVSWQTRLGIVADSRAGAVEEWVQRQFTELRALSENPTLAIYMTQLKAGGDPDAAEAGYLQNLLSVTAERTGFQSNAGEGVRANVARPGGAGLVIIDTKGRLLVGTPNPPAIEGAVRRYVDNIGQPWKARDGERMIDLFISPEGAPMMAFAVPVFSVQADRTQANQIGVILGLKHVAGELYPMLRQPGATDRTAEAVLVREDGGVIEYLSPLMDGGKALSRKLASNTPRLAATYGIARAGGFNRRQDYRGEDVIFVSREVKGTPWTLIYKVDAAEALGPSETRLKRLMTIFLLVIGVVAVAVIAVWYKGASRRAGNAAREAADMADRYEQQRNFLRLLTDSQPNANSIIDVSGHFRFANLECGRRVGMDHADIVGKNIANVFGAERAKDYDKLNREALEANEMITGMHRYQNGKGPVVIQTLHVPMAETSETPEGVLLVEEDITGAITERERRERVLRQMVGTLVAVVDARDPNASNHSTRVAKVARAIADEMDLEQVEADTAEFAGNLMNLGKILVPIDVLTKTGPLTDEEISLVRNSIQESAALLDGIEFDGPLADTIRQVQERFDGRGGPKGLAGDEILLPARIVSVANAFVAMVSARAHRSGMDIDRAIETLMNSAGEAYDRKVVVALVNHLENRNGREALASLGISQDGSPADQRPDAPA